MKESVKVQPHHLERGAYLYIRQSSMRQVIENVESAKRQYALRGRAIALGWRDEQIIVIDSDQGESGASAVLREGFQRLVSDVGMGHAGIVMGLEVSRLARNNADWQRLLEICALADTLILDEDGVYDPSSFNDRLLLGLKGTMSEAELHVIKARLRGGILNKVRRGEYRCVLPTGLIYDHAGNVTFDPDTQIRETIVHFFDTFSRVGSACQTVKAFRKEGLLFPSRLRNSETTVFRTLTASTAIRVLNNPRYAGAYAYGRRRYRRTIDGKKTLQRRDHDDWLACIPDAHPGYITWEQFQENLKILKTNGRGYEVARASPPREGTALLQGRAVCGQCGKHFRIRYTARRGRLDAWYVCDRAHGYRGEPNCQSIAGPQIDKAIGMLIAEQMTPAAVELTLDIRKEIEARYEEADRLRCRAIERAKIEADLAQRRFMLVDPNNRLVADTLEGEWNDKLRVLAKARDDRERAPEQDQLFLDEAVRERLTAMTVDFKKLWADPDTPDRERKRLLAHIIEDVTLIKMPAERTTKIHVRFKGGKIQTLTTMSPKSSAQQVKTQPGIVELVDKLLDKHIYSEIAELLNQQGYRPGGSARPGRHETRFTALRVAYLVHRYGLRSRYDRLRDRGMLTKREAAARLNIHETTLARWAEHGLVTRHAYNAHYCLYEIPTSNLPRKQCSRWNRLVDRAAALTTSLVLKPSTEAEGGVESQGRCRPRRRSSPDRRASHGTPPPRPSSDHGPASPSPAAPSLPLPS
ncbi:DNA invertase Pin-like site-specific DNA recombinase [Bradyrhizobium sp. USDA 4518]